MNRSCMSARPQRILHCLVCRVAIAHANMGIDSCRACGVFYRRTIKLKYHLECICGGKDIMKKKNIKPCRKCRFEKMSELVRKAAAGEISCDIKDGTDNNSGCSKISSEHWVNLQKRASPMDSEASNDDGYEMILSAQSFIDHSSYFEMEPSCSSTPLLHKMKKAYSTLCLVRKSCEINSLGGLGVQDELHNENVTLRSAKYSNMASCSQIFFVGVLDFAKSAFPEFTNISADNRHSLVQTNFPLIQSLDGLYRSYHYFPHENSVMASYTTYVNEETIQNFFNESPADVNREDAAHKFRKNMENTIKITKGRFRKMNPTVEEFIALFGLALWNDYTGSLSMETLDLVNRMRQLITKELHVMYVQKGITEYAPRLGELFCLRVNEEVCVQFPAMNFV